MPGAKHKTGMDEIGGLSSAAVDDGGEKDRGRKASNMNNKERGRNNAKPRETAGTPVCKGFLVVIKGMYKTNGWGIGGLF